MELNLDLNPRPGDDNHPKVIDGATRQIVYVGLYDGGMTAEIELPYSEIDALDQTIATLIEARRMLVAAQVGRRGREVPVLALERGNRAVVGEEDARVVEQITITDGGTLVTFASPFGGASFTRDYAVGETVVRIEDAATLAVAR